MTRSSSRFSAVSHPGVSLFRRFCGTKTPGWQNLVFWAQNQQRTHHKVGIARPPKAVHTAIYAKGACPYTHSVTDNRRTECAGLPWWSFGSRCARVVCRGSPHTFCTKRMVQKTKTVEVRARMHTLGTNSKFYRGCMMHYAWKYKTRHTIMQTDEHASCDSRHAIMRSCDHTWVRSCDP